MTRLIIPGALALVLAAGAWWLTSAPTPGPTDQPLGAVNAQESDDEAEIDTSTVVEMSLGNPDAAVTMIEYASFTCPHCARFHKEQFKQLKADYIDTGKIHFIYRDVYFDRLGLWAALVARCGGQERFFGIADMMYDQQSDWIGDQDPVAVADRLRKIGMVAGLSEEKLESCLTDNIRAKTLVAWYQENASADGVQSTPTLIINGDQYANLRYSELQEVLNEALAE